MRIYSLISIQIRIKIILININQCLLEINNIFHLIKLVILKYKDNFLNNFILFEKIGLRIHDDNF